MFGSGRAGALIDARTISSLPWGVWGDDDAKANTWSGNRVTTRSALQLLAVYGCNRFICEGISTLPIDVFRDAGDDRHVQVPTPGLLQEPTADLDMIDWLTQILTSALLDGNAYARKVYSGSSPDKISEVVPLDPGACGVRRVSGRKTVTVNGRDVGPHEILHIPGVMFPGSDVGLSPVEAARQAVGKGMAVEEFSAKFFSQGANLSGVIEDPGPVDPDRARGMAKIWARLHSGNRKAHLPGVLQGGAKWKVTGVTNEQAQFLQTHQFTQAQIAAFMFLIDPTEFGVSGDKGSSVTYANLEQRSARKVQVTFLPWIIRVERALSSLLPTGHTVKLNVSGLLRGDSATRYANYAIASKINESAAAMGEPPLLSTAEMREFEDLDPFTGPIPKILASSTLGEPELPAPSGRLLEVLRDPNGRAAGLREVTSDGAA